MDPLVERGFSVVLPRNNNLGTLYKAAADQRDNELRKQELIGKEFADIKLGSTKLRTGLQSGFGKLTKDRYDLMLQSQKDLYGGRISLEDVRTLKSKIFADHEVQKNFFESVNSDLDAMAEVVNKKPERFNQSTLVKKQNDFINNVFIKDEDGNIIGTNDATKSPSEILNDPDVYDDSALNKEYIDQLGSIALDSTTDSFGSTSKQSATSGLFETKGGKIVTDPNTGKPIPTATPESILLYDADPIRKLKLDKYAQSITPPGESWEKNRAKAFKQFVVDPFAEYKEDKVMKEQSDSSIGRGEKQANIESRYKTLRSIVDNYDESSLAQANNVMNNVQLEFRGGGMKGNLPGETVPDMIVIKKRETIEVPDQMSTSGFRKQNIWNEYEVPIRNEEQKEKAIFEINSILDEGGDKASGKIGNDAIRVIHDKKKKSAPKKGAFDNL
jgi:hypothetical protein